MQFPIVETECTITHEGHEYTNSGAIFDLDRGGCLYAGEPDMRHYAGPFSDSHYIVSGPLTTWNGEQIGTYWAISQYRNNFGARITCIRATIEGREYYGRYGSDWSQLVRLRPRKTA